jgi:hypothetical protein
MLTTLHRRETKLITKLSPIHIKHLPLLQELSQYFPAKLVSSSLAKLYPSISKSTTLHVPGHTTTMYKTEAGSKKFSFTRFISNSIPNIAGAPQDIDLSPSEIDLIFLHQLGEPDPLILSPQAFLHAGITSSPKTSAAVHKALLKNGVLVEGEKGVHTEKIGKRFTHELAMITSHGQKKVVNMLFWWEEEGMRWNKLIGELEELKVVVEQEKEAGGEGTVGGYEKRTVGGYEKRAKKLEGEIRLRPSLRGQDKREGEVLPEYAERK